MARLGQRAPLFLLLALGSPASAAGPGAANPARPWAVGSGAAGWGRPTGAFAPAPLSGPPSARSAPRALSLPLVRPVASFATTLKQKWDGAHGSLEPARPIPRAVLLIPGLTLKAKSFDPMARYLARNPANGGVVAVFVARDGQFHRDGARGPVMSDADVRAAKVFQLEYRDARAPSTEKAPQIGQALDAIARIKAAALGPAVQKVKVDVVTHSAGQHNFVEYLAGTKGTEKAQIHTVAFVTPAIRGTVMGNLGDKLGRPLGLQRAGHELAVGSPSIARLREEWPALRQQIGGKVTVVAVTGAPTLRKADGRLTIASGDGFMPKTDTRLSGERNASVPSLNPTPLNHLWNNRYSGVIREVERALVDGRR